MLVESAGGKYVNSLEMLSSATRFILYPYHTSSLVQEEYDGKFTLIMCLTCLRYCFP